jgi:N-acetylglutamate synthase-like GNAT family acetyltransferase
VTAEVRAMTPADIPAVQGVEDAAGQRFRDCDDPRVARCADDAPFTTEELTAWIERGRAWVATENGKVVGFIVVDAVDGCAHIDEVAVAPCAGRRGHGTALLDEASAWAVRSQLPAVTLTTFRDVPWNGPWYAHRGFRTLAEDEWTPAIRKLREEEHSNGLDKGLRIVMRRELGREGST